MLADVSVLQQLVALPTITPCKQQRWFAADIDSQQLQSSQWHPLNATLSTLLNRIDSLVFRVEVYKRAVVYFPFLYPYANLRASA